MVPRTGILAGIFLSGLTLETLFPLRKPTQPKLRRLAVNVAIAAASMILMRLTFVPLVLALAAKTASSGWGLAGALQWPWALEAALGLAALDYTLYLWHWLNHNVPFLWRFHNVHHVDLDLDVSTASRFHFGELMLSAGYRAGQIVVFGIDPATLVFFEVLVTSSALFHHSNLRLPLGVEAALSAAIVTPRMHGIHHSIVLGETNSNYSATTNLWDRLHGSLRLDVPQSEITIGVPSYREPGELGFFRSLLLPFAPQRPWRLPDGSHPQRAIYSHLT